MNEQKITAPASSAATDAGQSNKYTDILSDFGSEVKPFYDPFDDSENRELHAKFDRKENSYVRVAEHNKKVLKENVELREDSRKYRKICQAIGEDRAAEILARDRKSEKIL